MLCCYIVLQLEREWQLVQKNCNLVLKLVAYAPVEVQPCKPPIWPRFSNCRRYGHRWDAMLQPLRIHTLRLELCGGTLSRLHVHEPASLRWTVVMPLCAVELVAGMVAHMAEMPH